MKVVQLNNASPKDPKLIVLIDKNVVFNRISQSIIASIYSKARILSFDSLTLAGLTIQKEKVQPDLVVIDDQFNVEDIIEMELSISKNFKGTKIVIACDDQPKPDHITLKAQRISKSELYQALFDSQFDSDSKVS